MAPVVPLHDELMRAGDELEPVGMVELLRDVLSERVPGTAGGDAPSAPVVRVRPKQVAHGSLVGDLLDAVELADVVQRVERGRQPPVHAYDLILDHCCYRQIVE